MPRRIIVSSGRSSFASAYDHPNSLISMVSVPPGEIKWGGAGGRPGLAYLEMATGSDVSHIEEKS